MKRMRQAFSSEFKREAVAFLESSGRSQMQAAAKLGFHPSMLRSWRAIRKGVPPNERAGQASTPAAPLGPATPFLARDRAHAHGVRQPSQVIGTFPAVPR